MCVAYLNGDEGFYINFTDYHVFWACCSCDNGDGDDNIEVDAWSSIINCVVDGTGQTTETGINLTASQNVIIGCRITNCATGINGGNKWGTYGWNLFDNNTSDTSNDSYLDPLPYTTDTDTNEIDPDADDGYNDAANGDHNLKASRTYNGDGNDLVGLGLGA